MVNKNPFPVYQKEPTYPNALIAVNVSLSTSDIDDIDIENAYIDDYGESPTLIPFRALNTQKTRSLRESERPNLYNYEKTPS